MLTPAVLFFALTISYCKFSLLYIFCIQSNGEKSRVFFNISFNNLMHWKKKKKKKKKKKVCFVLQTNTFLTLT